MTCTNITGGFNNLYIYKHLKTITFNGLTCFSFIFIILPTEIKLAFFLLLFFHRSMRRKQYFVYFSSIVHDEMSVEIISYKNMFIKTFLTILMLEIE